MTRQIIRVETLHGQNDRALLRMVEARRDGVVVDRLDLLARQLGIDLLPLVGIIDDDDVGAAAEHAALKGGGQLPASHRCLPVHQPIVAGAAGVRKQRPIPAALHQLLEQHRLAARDLLVVGQADDATRRIMPQHPGAISDARHMGLEAARRLIDHQPPASPKADRLEAVRQHQHMPVFVIVGARFEFRHRHTEKARQVAAQHRHDGVVGHVIHHRPAPAV